MIEVHLYGKLRRFAVTQDPTSASVAVVKWRSGETVQGVVNQLGIPHDELGSNMFVNGKYATLETFVHDEDRLGLFPDDMQLLYKWYFAPPPAGPNPSSEESNSVSQSLQPSRESEK